MTLSFFKYYLKYIIQSQNRQKLILLAVIGLVISSFSLVVLQGVMGGLQNGLIERSKKVIGSGYIDLGLMSQKDEEYQNILSELDRLGVQYYPEFELEVMVKHENSVHPMVLHAVDALPHGYGKFLKQKNTNNLVLGSDLARSIGSYYGAEISIISPSHIDSYIQKVPKMATIEVSDFYSSSIPDVDSLHAWVRLKFVHNMIRAYDINKIVFYNNDFEKIQKSNFFKKYNLVSWEDQNSTLVWALNLETRVMLFLFVATSFLIGICIVSGFLIFYQKIKIDMASFWLLGLSKTKILKLTSRFGHLITLSSCAFGLILGLTFLFILKNNQLTIMPDVFIERSLPVKITSLNIVISFVVPYFISTIFTNLVFSIFKKEEISFLSFLRKML